MRCDLSLLGCSGRIGTRIHVAKPEVVVLEQRRLLTFATTTALVAAPNPSDLNQPITLTAIVTRPSGTPTPTGQVSFTFKAGFNGVTYAWYAPLDATGRATYTIPKGEGNPSLAVGNQAIAADYSGDVNFKSSSGTTTLTVTAATTTSLIAAPNPSVFGQPVTFTATVTATTPGRGTPTGNVAFQDGSTLLGLGTLDASGQARFTTATLAAGNHTITATYNSLNSTFASLSYDVTTQTVLVPTTTQLNAYPNSSTVGQPVTFTAFVIPTMGTGTPTGTVTFTIDGMAQPPTMATTMASSAAVFQLTTSILAPGTHTITAAYSGDGRFSASTAFNPVTLTVQSPPLVTVRDVQLVLDRRKNVTQVIVSLSGDVDPGKAASTGIYRLATAGRKGSFDARNAGILKLRSAAYNSVTDTVTLTPLRPFRLVKPVQVRVNGQSPAGLIDRLGRLIDGNHDGQPGGNATVLLRSGGVSIQRSAPADTRQTVQTSALDVLLAQGSLTDTSRVGRSRARTRFQDP